VLHSVKGVKGARVQGCKGARLQGCKAVRIRVEGVDVRS